MRVGRGSGLTMMFIPSFPLSLWPPSLNLQEFKMLLSKSDLQAKFALSL